MKIKLMESKSPIINITNLAMNKIEEYVHGIDKEIGWLGTVTRDGLTFLIEDVFLFKQEVNATTTEITPEGLSEFAMELMASDENGLETWNNMKLWGHSHVNMGVNPSGQDNKQIETFESCGHDFFIRMIANKKGDVRLDLYDYTTGIIYEELNYKVVYEEQQLASIERINKEINRLNDLLYDITSLPTEYALSIKQEIKDKVTTKTFKYPQVKGQVGGWDYSNNYWDKYDNMYCSKKKEEEISVAIENDVFLGMSEEEVFELNSYLECDEDISQLIVEPLTKVELEQLGKQVRQYVQDNKSAYLDYIDELENLYL